MKKNQGSHRTTSIWSFVFILLVIAFWRTLAPERSARAVRRVFEARIVAPNVNRTELENLQKLQEAIQREKAALLRLREEYKNLNYSAVASRAKEENEDAPSALNSGKLRTSKENTMKTSAGDEVADTVEVELEKEMDSSNTATNEKNDFEVNSEDEIGEDECPIVLSPMSAKAGMGTQTEHIWAHLTIAKAIPNACVALPPIVADFSQPSPRYIPFQEVFDVNKLSESGIRFVPLSVCKGNGIAKVFDDAFGNEKSIKSYAEYISNSHPVLAHETELITDKTTASKFLDPTKSTTTLKAQVTHILDGKNDEVGRYCIGMGRMLSEEPVDPHIVENFVPASKIADFVTDRFPEISDTLFVKLRWNKSLCEGTRKEHGTVCIFGDATIRQEDYVQAMKLFAKKVQAKRIYLSFPAHIPEEVLEYFSKNLKTIDPVVLQLEGDAFASNVIEREMAVRSLAFVPDGGAWGTTIQISRKFRNNQRYNGGINSFNIVKRWKDELSSRNSGGADEQ